MDNYEQYKHHFALLEYREAEPIQRIAIFYSNIQQFFSTVCGFAKIMSIESNNSPQSTEFSELHQISNEICLSLQKLKDELDSDSLASERLRKSTDYQYIVDDLHTLSLFLQGMVEDLPFDMDSKFWSERFSNFSLFLQVSWDILVKIDESYIPENIRDAHRFHMSLRQGEVGNPDQLSDILLAATHPLAVIRHQAAVLLRHYSDERGVVALINLLTDEEEDIAAWAANSLGSLRSREAIPALIACLHRAFDNQAYLGWIAEALSKMPDDAALDPIIALLEHIGEHTEHWQTQMYPISGLRRALEAIGSDKAEAALKKYFVD